MGASIAVYTGQRKGSLFALKWKHVDVDHGTLASFKTNLPESWTGDPVRREECKIPTDVVFKTKHDLALEMIRSLIRSWEKP